MDSTFVYKYQLSVSDSQSVPTYEGYKILSLQVQNGVACLWVLVDTSRRSATIPLKMYGTGHCIPSHPGEFVGTFQMYDGELVFHVFVDRFPTS